MATVNEYGREWDERIPRGALSWLVGRLHVGTCDDEIAADIRQRADGRPEWTADLVAQAVEYALACHRDNQGLYRAVMSGDLREEG